MIQQHEAFLITIDDKTIKVSNPDKVLWPELGLTKLGFFHTMMKLAPYLLKYSENRLLTVIRYPDGIDGESFYQKNIPSYAPDWIAHRQWKNTTYILLNDRATLAWLINSAALEYHIGFDRIKDTGPSALVFDLDPTITSFDWVAELAMDIKACMNGLGLDSFVKTSGSSGLQVYIPIQTHYTYEQAREVNHFLAKYFVAKNPTKVTIERLVKNRGDKVYFDYLQMWAGKTIAAPYTSRANRQAKVSTPISWEELRCGARPEDFTLLNIVQRIEEKGDLFAPVVDNRPQSLEHLLRFIAKGQPVDG